MFTHYPLDPVELKRITEEDGSRSYITPENNAYPSVTTFLGDDPTKQEGLEKWREKIGRKEANKITSRAATRGEEMHTAIEKYLTNEKKFLQSCSPQATMLFKKILYQLKKIDNIRGQELPLYSDALKLAGTVDLIGEYDGVLSVIDFKTARKFKRREFIDDYFIQTLAYSIMIEEIYGIKASQLVIIISDEQSSKGYAYVEDRKKYKNLLVKKLKEFRERNKL